MNVINENLMNQLGISEQLKQDPFLSMQALRMVHKGSAWNFIFVFSKILPIEIFLKEEGVE